MLVVVGELRSSPAACRATGGCGRRRRQSRAPGRGRRTRGSPARTPAAVASSWQAPDLRASSRTMRLRPLRTTQRAAAGEERERRNAATGESPPCSTCRVCAFL
jgi:hypothetical protein